MTFIAVKCKIVTQGNAVVPPAKYGSKRLPTSDYIIHTYIHTYNNFTYRKKSSNALQKKLK